MKDKTISLNTAKDLFCRICMESNLCYKPKETCEDLRLFDKLPLVTPSRPTGKWIKRHYVFENRIGLDMWRCSNCSEEYSYDAETGVGITDAKFCPNCGARMDGDDNER